LYDLPRNRFFYFYRRFYWKNAAMRGIMTFAVEWQSFFLLIPRSIHEKEKDLASGIPV